MIEGPPYGLSVVIVFIQRANIFKLDIIFKKLLIDPGLPPVHRCASDLAVFLAPLRNLPNQIQREGLAVWELDRALAGLVLRQPGCEYRHSLRAGVQANMPLGGRELDQVAALPVGGHTPGDLLLGLRDAGLDGGVDLPQIVLRLLRLGGNVLLNRRRRLSAVVALLRVLE